MKAQGGNISNAVLVGVPGRVSHNIEWREQRVTLRYGEVPAEFVKSQEEREFLAALKRAIAASEAEIAELCKGFRVPSYMEDNHPQAEKLREIYERHLGAFYEKTRQFYPVGLFSWLAGDLAHAKDCCPRPTYGVMVAESLTRSYCGRRQLQRGRASAYSTSDGHRIMDTPLGSKVTDPSWVLILPNMKLETVDTSNRVPLLPAMAAATLAVQNKLVPSHYAPCLETVVGIRREEIPVHLGVYANAGKLVLGTGSDLKSAKRKSKGPVKYMVF